MYFVCNMCGEKFKPTILNQKILEPKNSFYKRNSEEIQKELDKNFWTMFTYWESQDFQAERLLCRDCSVKVGEFIKQNERTYKSNQT